jgi:hypothetical protein
MQNVKAFEKPSEFNLRHNAGRIERDGKVVISWEISKYVDTYSLYVSDSEIKSVSSAELVKEFGYSNTRHSISFTENDNGTYYYVMIAKNELGSTISNNIDFEVAVPPKPLGFSLSVNKEETNDGNFKLNWTASSYAEEYEIYRDRNENFSSPLRIATGITDTNYTFTAHKNGTYFFKVKARNPRGEIESNVKKVIVDLKGKEGILFDFTDPVFNRFFWFTSIIIGLLLYIGVQRYYEYPVLFVLREDKYEEEKLGRFIQQYKSKYIPNFWIIEFKHGNKGIKKYYSFLSFDTLRQYVLGSKYAIQEYTGEIVHKTLDLSEMDWVQIPKIKRVDTLLNKAKYILYRVINRICPNKRIVRGLHDSIEYVETGEYQKEIDVLQLRLMDKKITTAYDVEYKEKVIDEAGEHIEDKEVEGLSIHAINELKRKKSVIKDSVKTSNKREVARKIDDINEGINISKSIDEIRSIHDLEMSKLMNDYKNLGKKYSKAKELNRQYESNEEVKLTEEIERIIQESTMSKDDIMSYTARLLELKHDGVSDKSIIETAWKEFQEKKDYRKHGEVKTENEKLKKELEMVKKENERLWETASKRSPDGSNKIIVEDNLEH